MPTRPRLSVTRPERRRLVFGYEVPCWDHRQLRACDMDTPDPRRRLRVIGFGEQRGRSREGGECVHTLASPHARNCRYPGARIRAQTEPRRAADGGETDPKGAPLAALPSVLARSRDPDAVGAASA